MPLENQKRWAFGITFMEDGFMHIEALDGTKKTIGAKVKRLVKRKIGTVTIKKRVSTTCKKVNGFGFLLVQILS